MYGEVKNIYLKKCPFCDNKVSLFLESNKPASLYVVNIVCFKCNVVMRKVFPEDYDKKSACNIVQKRWNMGKER